MSRSTPCNTAATLAALSPSVALDLVRAVERKTKTSIPRIEAPDLDGIATGAVVDYARLDAAQQAALDGVLVVVHDLSQRDVTDERVPEFLHALGVVLPPAFHTWPPADKAAFAYVVLSTGDAWEHLRLWCRTPSLDSRYWTRCTVDAPPDGATKDLASRELCGTLRRCVSDTLQHVEHRGSHGSAACYRLDGSRLLYVLTLNSYVTQRLRWEGGSSDEMNTGPSNDVMPILFLWNPEDRELRVWKKKASAEDKRALASVWAATCFETPAKAPPKCRYHVERFATRSTAALVSVPGFDASVDALHFVSPTGASFDLCANGTDIYVQVDQLNPSRCANVTSVLLHVRYRQPGTGTPVERDIRVSVSESGHTKYFGEERRMLAEFLRRQGIAA